jgi:hypothetical protein
MGDAFGLIKAHLSEPGEQRQVAVSARALSDDAFDMLAALLSPGAHRIALMPPGTAEQTWLAAEGSWACQEGEEVRQGGPRRLWDELEALHREWSDRGCPPRQEIGLTVTASGEHRIWTGPDQKSGWPSR